MDQQDTGAKGETPKALQQGRPRREVGSGTVGQRKDGYWVGRTEGGWSPQGTRRRITVTAKTEAECKRRLKLKIRQIQTEGIPAVGSGKVTVRSWAETWLPLHEAEVRPTTYATDRGTVRKWIVPTIGHRRLADLTPADLRALRDTIVKAGRSSTTAHHSHTILVKMLRDAIREGHTVPERVMLTAKPRKAANDRAAIPVDQALALLAAIGQRDDSSRWLLGILYGLRQGEVLGLGWDHVDLDAPSILVEWQLQRLGLDPAIPDGFRARHLTGPMWQTETKTAAGKRSLPLVSVMAASLAATKETWEPNPWGLVWTHDGQPIRAEHDRATWKGIQAGANVAHPSGRAWHVHECRHTVATLLMRQKTDRAVIRQILGQSKLVESYLHADGADALAAMEGVMHQLTAPGGQIEGAP